jgi:hypothetical protein
MFISMQGPWTVKVTSNEGNLSSRRFTINGTGTAADKSYNGTVGTTVDLSTLAPDKSWTINIQCKQGGIYTNSDTQVKFPVKVGSNYQFNIESNDAGSGSDPILDDLILTCSTPVTINDYIIYGHVSDYSGLCLYNPCYRRYFVIDTWDMLKRALQYPVLKDAIEKLYPKRIPIKWPNPPDPGPFTPMMIPVLNDSFMPAQLASVYSKINKADVNTTSAAKKSSKGNDALSANDITLYRLISNIMVNQSSASVISNYGYDKVAIGAILDHPYYYCATENVVNQSIFFKQYDRSIAELAGGPYTGDGVKNNLGAATTDINGNYIFRFQQSNADIAYELTHDVAVGEDPVVQMRPDIIVSIPNMIPSNPPLYESAPHFNVNNLTCINICLPKSVLQNPMLCQNDNLITAVGAIPVPGAQNTSFNPSVRDNSITHFAIDGKITNAGSVTTGPAITCGCWNGSLKIWGCMSNQDAYYYTIRYLDANGNWNFVSEEYHCIKHTDQSWDLNTKVGPFSTQALNVPGYGNGKIVPYYKNIQREHDSGVDWWDPYYKTLIPLNSVLYQTTPRGPVSFRVDVYKQNGDHITSDLITLFIDNDVVDAAINDAYFNTTVESECVLYALTDAEINQPLPLNVLFKANQPNGFLQFYNLYMGKGKHDDPSFAVPPANASQTYQLRGGSFPSCADFIGTVDVLGEDADGWSHIQMTPSNRWLEPDQDFCTFTLNLHYQKRGTEGIYFDQDYWATPFIFAIKRVN